MPLKKSEPTWDVAIVGAGFGGALLALIAQRLGRSVLLIEKGRHPRFAIGESSTPLADLLWLELTSRYGLTDLASFAKWGTWRQAHPEVACGLKRGFTFYHHQAGRPFNAAPDRRDQLIVAASPNDAVADTHWYRPEFDHYLVRAARRLGVDYLDECEVTEVGFDGGQARIAVRHRWRTREFRARFVVDASNHRGPLPRSLGLADRDLPHFPHTEALYTHFHQVRRLDELPLHAGMDRTPYPVDDAAVHHVFDGGWIWVLRFVNGVTSAGVAARESVARRLRFEEGAAAWARLLAEYPTVGRQFAGAQPCRPFVHVRRPGFRVGPAAGLGWALLPSAAGFVDPLLSSGFTLTLLGIERLAEALGKGWNDPQAFAATLSRHAADTPAELEVLEDYVAALYATMGDFQAFTEIARLYFCATIYCETARRLGRPEAAGGFLLREHPGFAAPAAAACAAARSGASAADLRRRIDPLLARFDLGGLADPARRPWYPVKADDLREGRNRIGATSEEIEALLRRAGFDATRD